MREQLRRLVRLIAGEETFIALRGIWWRWKLRLTDYEPETRALPQLVARGAVCLDVGGNIGQYAYYLARAAGAAGVVHSFEPLTYNRRIFARVVRLPNVVLHPFAAGARAETLRIAVTAQNIGEAHVSDSEGEIAEVIALDDWGTSLPRLDFVKIDVEGYELEVLRGAKALIERFGPVLLCEISDLSLRYGHSPAEAFAFLQSRGYCANVWSGGKLVPVDGRRNGVINYIFTR